MININYLIIYQLGSKGNSPLAILFYNAFRIPNYGIIDTQDSILYIVSY